MKKMTAKNPFVETIRGYECRFQRDDFDKATYVSMTLPKSHWFFQNAKLVDQSYLDKPRYDIYKYNGVLLNYWDKTDLACGVSILRVRPDTGDIGWYVEKSNSIVDAIMSAQAVARWLDDPKSETSWNDLLQ